MTKNEIKKSNDFSGLLLLPNGYELYTLYPGGNHLHYYLFDKAENIIFSGSDFKPSILHNIDDVQSLVSLLGFLTAAPGDVDSDYFKGYTEAQFNFVDSRECEEIKLLVSDFEDSDKYNKVNHNRAVKYFTKNYYQDLTLLPKPKEFIIVNKKKVYVFDNGGETYDRYTIVLSDCDVYGCSDNPFFPTGFAQFSFNVADNYMFHAYGANWRERCKVNAILKEQFAKYIEDNRHGSNIGKLINPRTLNSDVLQYINQITKD